MSDVRSIHEAPLELRTSRRRAARFLAVAILFVAAGVLLLPQSPLLAWSSIVFFGLGVIVFAIQVAHPSLLVLDADGFQSRVLLQRNGYRRSWLECSAFTAISTGSTKLVVYTTANKDHAVVRPARSKLARGDEALQSGFGGLSADQLAELMNRYRDAKLAPEP